ncbi:LuxR C-terminal-related transcriptional regulator [Mycobacterium europaeum]|uniref:ATP-binding protein n=1 Tax=Mycobacterium europaeum TaxID=761804 RepID=UPI002AE06DA2|nr:LuxR C-terminal-related transcriptional regulator [Mycobacterium europaeum]MEA1159250.1 LuxR C-terminal-related transcriptional regulator [Mycobacterium europaeum]
MDGPLLPGSRAAEAEDVSDFLTTCSTRPACLLLEGEAGIGKTTLWLAAIEQARARGMHVLTARAAATESVTAYISLTDLFSGIPEEVLDALPAPQRMAVDRMLLQVSDDGQTTDQRAIAAAFLSLIEILSDRAPVLVAIDDLQWLDPSSARIIAFAARRFSGPVGLLATVRTGDGDDVSWFQFENPNGITRIALKPLTIAGLHQVITARLGRSVSRHAMLRIHDASGGNPFYALELARTIPEGQTGIEMTLPTTLAGVVTSKIGVLDDGLREILLAAACLAEPTVDVVSKATGWAVDECVQRLLVAEERGIVTIDRNRLRFTHPLLTAAVYTAAPPAQRRDMHRRLAALVDHPELRARHLALAATHGDAATLEALDAAAELASRRGAPAAAAEFMELANELGAGSPERQIRCGEFHFSAGDAARAREVLDEVLRNSAPVEVHAEALSLLGLWALLDGSSRDAARLLQRAADAAAGDNGLLGRILVSLSFARINIYEFDAAVHAANEAVNRAVRLDDRQVLSQALSMQVLVHFLVGEGFDETTLRTAMLLDDGQEPSSAMLWPTLQRAALLVGTGKLDDGRRELRVIRQRYIERGADSEMMVDAFHGALNEIWRGNFAEASLIGEDALQRARLLDEDLPLAVALMIQAMVAAYAGDEPIARRDATDALMAARRCDSPALVTVWPTTTLGFLEVSLGNYEAALQVLSPLVAAFEEHPRATEIFVTPFLPDAAEALIHLGRFDEADSLIEVLEANGRRLDRPWMLASGARCRAMLLAGRRDLGAALVAAQGAMAEHERLPMPFERARTQLLLGEILRRQRSREKAAAAMRAAAATFEELGTPLWERRARTSLERINFGRADSKVLTSAEQRIADLAAAGKTNHDIAAALFISPKTVEVHLSRIYRKLGIRSRAELGRRLDRLESDA